MREKEEAILQIGWEGDWIIIVEPESEKCKWTRYFKSWRKSIPGWRNNKYESLGKAGWREEAWLIWGTDRTLEQSEWAWWDRQEPGRAALCVNFILRAMGSHCRVWSWEGWHDLFLKECSGCVENRLYQNKRKHRKKKKSYCSGPWERIWWFGLGCWLCWGRKSNWQQQQQ